MFWKKQKNFFQVGNLYAVDASKLTIFQVQDALEIPRYDDEGKYFCSDYRLDVSLNTEKLEKPLPLFLKLTENEGVKYFVEPLTNTKINVINDFTNYKILTSENISNVKLLNRSNYDLETSHYIPSHWWKEEGLRTTYDNGNIALSVWQKDIIPINELTSAQKQSLLDYNDESSTQILFRKRLVQKLVNTQKEMIKPFFERKKLKIDNPEEQEIDEKFTKLIKRYK